MKFLGRQSRNVPISANWKCPLLPGRLGSLWNGEIARRGCLGIKGFREPVRGRILERLGLPGPSRPTSISAAISA